MRAMFASMILATAFLLAAAGTAFGDSPGKMIARGNRDFDRGDYDRAVEQYEKASVRAPESPVVAFNLGDAYYRKEDYQKARKYFEDAALKTTDLSLESNAWYNLGNCAVREAERQVDSDLEKALELYQESVRFYGTALEKDPDFSDAAFNMEIARLVIKDLLDKIKKQQEIMQAQQEKMKEIIDSLSTLIAREADAAGRSSQLASDERRKPQGWEDRVELLERDQMKIEDGTGEVRRKLEDLFPEQQPPPVARASSHLDTSLANQRDALQDLDARKPGKANADQEEALEQLKKSLAALTEGQQQPQGGDQGEEQQQREQAQQEPQEPEESRQQRAEATPRDETAQDILDEEKENKKKRQREARQRYRRVDKDW